ncbi:MAG: HDOD domain-containing protein [Gammaproteobacteria bacterium]
MAVVAKQAVNEGGSSPSAVDTSTAMGTGDASFAFVQALATELSSGKVDLPGFPDIVARVQHVLADDNCSTDKVVKVLGTEPVLAGQLMSVANSVALNPSGKSISDLRTAVARVGLNTVRTATIAYAVKLLRAGAELKGIAPQLNELWQRNVSVASISYVLARKRTQVNPDTALLTGLLHGVGRLYIMTRAVRHPGLFSNPSTYQLIERDWHLSIATALLENWEIAPEIVAAVRDSEDYAREPRGAAGLTDVLVAANMIVVHHGQPPEFLQARLQTVRAVARLELTREICEALLVESEEEIAALRDVLN